MSNEQGFRGVPGVPDGWEVVAFREARYEETYLNHDGRVFRWTQTRTSAAKCVIVRKIETPKRYRQFKNGEEYSPHFDRIVIYKSQDKGDCFYRPSCFSNERVWLGPDHVGKQWGDAFIELRFKDDGTPFGVEVTE